MSYTALDLPMVSDQSSVFKRLKKKINLELTLRSKDKGLSKAGDKRNSKEKWMQGKF